MPKEKPQLTQISQALPGLFKNADEALSLNRFSSIIDAAKSSSEKTEHESSLSSEVKSDIREKTLWNDFLLFSEESRKAKKKKDEQVWIDADLKIILERIHCAGVRLPIKHLMNGMLKAFFTANQKDIEKLLRQKIKL